MNGRTIVMVGLGFTALVVLAGVAQAANTGKKLEFTPQPKFRKLDFEGLQVEMDVAFRNPTSGRLRVHDPLVVMRQQIEGAENGELLRLDLKGRSLIIQPKAEGKLSDPDQLGGKILLKVPYAKMLQFAPEAISAVLGLGKPFVIEVETHLTVEAPNVPTVRLKDRQSITLQQPIAQ